MKYNDKMFWYNKVYKLIYKFEPKSFWEFKKNTILDKLIKDDLANKTLQEDLKSKKESETYNNTWGARTSLSKFNTEYARRIIEYYTCKGDKILDPFAGRTRMEICNLLGREYTGFEINSNYTRSGLINDDCINIDKYNLNKEYDMLFTCPPYWEMEQYSIDNPIPGDLSMLKTYSEFEIEYKKRFSNVVPYIKDNGLCSVVISNYRKDGEFIPLEYLTINTFFELGWKIYDMIILEMNPAARQPYYSQAVTKRRQLTTHEYLLIFHKNTDISERKFNEDYNNINNNSINKYF
jgi:DNA modification methylase